MSTRDRARRGDCAEVRPDVQVSVEEVARRITDEHRLVYKVTDHEVRIAVCRYHYG